MVSYCENAKMSDVLTVALFPRKWVANMEMGVKIA